MLKSKLYVPEIHIMNHAGTEMITIEQLTEHLTRGFPVIPGTPMHDLLVQCSHETMRVTAIMNGSYHTAEDIRRLMAELTGKPVDQTFNLFPPFHCDFGKRITIGKNVFINAGCCFQDQGGITIGDSSLIGHKVVLATINHGFRPEERSWCYPAPITIGKNVWIGSNATILQGVTIGDNAIIAAGAVVSKDVASGTVAGGVPARFIRNIEDTHKKNKENKG